MLVSDVINFAKNGELKQLSVAEVDPDNENRAANVATIISYINLGIIELYKRFGLATQSQTLQNVVDGASYSMTDDYLYLTYAVGNNDQKTEIPINNEFATFSIFEPAPFQLFVTKDNNLHSDITEVFITYIATPALLTSETQTIPLQSQFIDCLLLYIASRAHAALNSAPNTEETVFYKRFEASCARIRRDGLMTPDNQSNYKLWERGWK